MTATPTRRHVLAGLTGRLYAANEVSGTIVGYTTESGRPRPLGVVARTGSPVCVVFREHKAS